MGVCLAVFVGLLLYVGWFTRSTYMEELELQLAGDASITAGEAALALAGGSSAAVQGLAERVGASSGSRITVIAPDGTVLGDSAEAPELMDNHASRPEVALALRGQRGSSIRHSATVGYDMLYVAVPIGESPRVLGVARAALPLATVDRAAAGLVSAVAAAVGIAAVTAIVLAAWLGRTIAEPIERLTMLARAMADGHLDARVRTSSRDEVGELGQAFNQMADRLQETFAGISAERNRLAAILGTVTDGLVIIDRAGQVVMLNAAAERLFRVTAGRAAGEPFIAVSRDHELAALLERADGSAQLVELGLPRRQVRAMASRIPGTDDQSVLLLQDVTELRRLESVRRDFAVNVSHELRTPLAAIKAVVETLEAGALDDPIAARNFLGRLHDEVDALTELVRELLELSRIESGRTPISLEPTDLGPMLHAAAARLEAMAERAGLELRLAIAEDLPPVLADRERLRQVIANLLHNSIKFTPPGGRIELSAERCSGPARALPRGKGPVGPAPEEVAIRVADSGVGVPPDDLDRIFERFFKADRSRSGGGTGLGLAIAKHIVQAHGGSIRAESDGAHGTTLIVTLPVAARAAVGAGTR